MSLLPKELRKVMQGVLKLIIIMFIIVYIISPIDLLPEAVFGPVGLIDDVIVFVIGSSILGWLGLGQKQLTFAKEKRTEVQAKLRRKKG
jgi:uncharacterized membrane protein YkvA (DUF1232 family)